MMFRQIFKELGKHVPFTTLGALSGIIVMAIFYNLPHKISHNIFYVLHPAHVVLSAMATASMYKLHSKGKCKFWILVLIGYFGSIGIATLSDSIIPYFGEGLLHLPNRNIHIGFIEKWWLVNPLAFVGIAIAYFKPTTKLPHSGHVLLSTWASLFHIIMAMTEPLIWVYYVVIFLFLFVAVWLPCCLSDIIFPLLFVNRVGGTDSHDREHEN